MSASGEDAISSVYHGRLLIDHGRLEIRNGAACSCPSLNQRDKKCAFLYGKLWP